MSTHVDLTSSDDPFRISLCSSGACLPHLEFVRDGREVTISPEDVPAVRAALDELLRFTRVGKKPDAETRGHAPPCPFCGTKCDLSDSDSVSREGEEGECEGCGGWWSIDKVDVVALWWKKEESS